MGGRLSRIALLACGFVFANLPFYIGRMPWAGEEGRRALIAQEMILTGNYVEPTVFQKPYLKKPPLHNMLIAAFVGRDGIVTPAEARAVSIGAFALLAAAVYLLARRYNRGIAPLALAFVAMNYLLMCEYGNSAESDLLLALMTFLSYAAYIMGPTRPGPVLASSLFMGLGILTKGISPLFFYPGILIHALITRPGRARRLVLLGVHAVFSLLLPVLWLAAHRDGLASPLITTVGSEVADKAFGNLREFLTHWVAFPFRVFAVLLPWSAVLAIGYRRTDSRSELYRTSLYNGFASLAVMILAAGARDRYIIPAIPFVAIAAAHHIDPTRLIPRRYGAPVFAAMGIACLAFSVFLIRHGIPIQGTILALAGACSVAMSARRLRLFEAGVAAAILLLIFYEHGLYNYRTTYRVRSRPVAERIQRAMTEDLPVVVEPHPDLVPIMADLEGMIGRPAYDREVARFDRHYLIRVVADRDMDPDGGDPVLLRIPYARLRAGEIVVQRIGSDRP